MQWEYYETQGCFFYLFFFLSFFWTFSVILLYWLLSLPQTHQSNSHLKNLFFFFFGFYLSLKDHLLDIYMFSVLSFWFLQMSSPKRGFCWPPYLKLQPPITLYLLPGFISFYSTYCWQMLLHRWSLKLFVYLHIAFFHCNTNAMRMTLCCSCL